MAKQDVVVNFAILGIRSAGVDVDGDGNFPVKVIPTPVDSGSIQALISALLPGCQIDEDENGQIIIYTNMKYDDGTNMVPMK